jgi:hypothetical protein
MDTYDDADPSTRRAILGSASVVPFSTVADLPWTWAGPASAGEISAGEPPPATDSEVGADRADGQDRADGAGREIHYHFPVEIEVRTVVDRPDQDNIVTSTLRRLVEGLDST